MEAIARGINGCIMIFEWSKK